MEFLQYSGRIFEVFSGEPGVCVCVFITSVLYIGAHCAPVHTGPWPDPAEGHKTRYSYNTEPELKYIVESSSRR